MKEELNMRNKATQTCTKVVNRNGSIIENKKHISNIFNDHFASVAENLLQKSIHTSIMRTDNSVTLEWTPDRSFYIRQTIAKEIADIIDSLKTDASAGYDGIKSKLVKTLKTTLVPIVSKIINNCIKNRIRFQMN